MRITARDRFLATPQAVKDHADLVSKADFQWVLDVALETYAEKCAKEEDAAATHWKQVGAREFVETLCNLSTQKTAKTRKDLDNLTE